MSVTLGPRFSLRDTAEEAVPFCRSVSGGDRSVGDNVSVSGDGGSGRDPARPAPRCTPRRTDP